METMVLLVLLAIVWAAVGVYWLRTRAPSQSLGLGPAARRLGLEGMRSRSSVVQPLQTIGAVAARAHHGPPGHSLTDPARRPEPGSQPRRRVSSQQARLRRRKVLLGLAGFAAVTLLAIFAVGGTAIVLLHLMADALLLGYVLLLVQYQREIELDRTRNLPVYAPPPRRTLVATGTDGR